MIFQRVIKGIPARTKAHPFGITHADARDVVKGGGWACNWWRNAPDGLLHYAEVAGKLTADALIDHLVNYDSVRTTTPFISTTAGTIESDAAKSRNLYFPPLYTALRFATRNFTQDGYVMSAYVYVLSRRSVELEEFAEEVRDVNTYTSWYAYHPEGEIVAKIVIPAQRIEKLDFYEIDAINRELDASRLPTPSGPPIEDRDVYRDPWRYANVRGFPEVP